MFNSVPNGAFLKRVLSVFLLICLVFQVVLYCNAGGIADCNEKKYEKRRVGANGSVPFDINRKEVKMITPMKVTHRIWGEKYPTTPELGYEQTGLGFQAVPGVGMAGDTVVLTANYVACSPILNYYEGQLPGPILLVAFDPNSGVVHNHPVLDAKSPPVRVLTPEGVKPIQGDSIQKAPFNVDMPSLLALPPEAARYHVFLWLDNVVSPVILVDTPENQNRTLSLLSNRKSSRIVSFNPTKKLEPESGSNSILLETVDRDGVKIVTGSWTPGINNDGKSPYFLSLMAFNHRDRTCGWTSVDINSLPEQTDKRYFQLDPSQLTGSAQENQSVFVMAFSMDHPPQVLEIKP